MEDGDDDDNDDDDETTLMAAKDEWTAQSISGLWEAWQVWRHVVIAGKLGALTNQRFPKVATASRLPEIVLPIVMPFLRCERVHVGWCVGYGGIMSGDWEWGRLITTTRPSEIYPSFLREVILSRTLIPVCSGLLKWLGRSQQSDLHPIPHLRKLSFLDSRCIQFDDSRRYTYYPKHVSITLKSSYQGFNGVTDDGVISIVKVCSKLKVLRCHTFQLPTVTAIGEHLTNLRAVYMRDNYL
jgi:hypothetical protein